MTRFVILHHTLTNGEHWDLMLEHQGTLLTWQLLAEPRGHESLPIAARRIGNHRLAYLTYEGPVSGDRGEVRRVDAGELHMTSLGDSHCRFDAAGKVLLGCFQLQRLDDGWVLESVAGSV